MEWLYVFVHSLLISEGRRNCARLLCAPSLLDALSSLADSLLLSCYVAQDALPVIVNAAATA